MSKPPLRWSFDLGFAPDADPAMPGVVADCLNVIPTERGMRPLGGTDPTWADVTASPTFTSEQVVAVEAFDVGTLGSQYEYVGTGGHVYVRPTATGVFTDISRTATYTAIGVNIWTFERSRNELIAAVGTDDFRGDLIGAMALQSATFGTTNKLAAITAAPTCAIVTSAERFVLAFNGYAGNNDSWYCSERDNPLGWTLAPATQCATGRLTEPVGPILGAKPFGNDVIAYKRDAMFLGRYTPGDPEVWKWSKLRHSVGVLAPRAVCVLPDGRHAFVGPESCYLFDGNNVVDVLDGKARRFYQQQRGVSFTEHQYVAVYDGLNQSVWFGFPIFGYTGMGVIVMHVATGKLGYAVLPAHTIGAVQDNLSPARVPVLYEFNHSRRFKFSYGTADELPPQGVNPALYFQSPYIKSGDLGDPFDFIDINELHVDVVSASAAPSMDVELLSRDGRYVASETSTLGTPQGAAGERHAARKSAHWHRVKVSPFVAMEVSGVWAQSAGRTGRRVT